MSKEPWLDGLTEDWEPDPQLPVLSEGTAQASFHRQKASTRHSQPSTAYDTVCGSGASRKAEFDSPAGSSTQPHRPPSTSDKADEFLQPETVQIRPSSSAVSDQPPEWRLRILQGESASGGADLFAPMGLERMFEPPKGSRPAESINPSAHRPSEPPQTSNCTTRRDEGRISTHSAIPPPVKRNISGAGDGHDGHSFTDTRIRTASGMEELRNEGFTPIPPPTVDESELEQVNSAEFSSIHISPRLYYNRKTPTSKTADDNGNHDQSNATEATPEMTSQSLPEGLSMGTQDASSLGGFVNTRRGGYSHEGSFLNRPLSPSSMHSRKLNSSASSQATKGSSRHKGRNDIPQNSQPAAARPSTPVSHEDEATRENSDGKSSVSPLKLFAAHDTFTNNKLLRRMGQFEEGCDGEANGLLHPEAHTQNDLAKSNPSPHRAYLNSYNNDEAEYMNNGRVSSTRVPGVSQPKASQQRDAQAESAGKSQNAHWLKRQKVEPAETKRGRNSPTKDSSPKRRRTLQNAESEQQMWHKPLLHSSEFISHNDLESSDIDDIQEVESPDRSPSKIPAPDVAGDQPALTNSAHHPRPTSSRPSSRRVENGISRHSTGHKPQEPNDTQPGHIPRKGSITTQDFLDEATKIMQFIRAKGRLKSGLPNLVESDVENADQSYADESSEEEFSRPPSRGMAHVPRLRVPRAPNPRIVSHLKKFEEDDDQDMFMGASAMSLRLRMVPESSGNTPIAGNSCLYDEGDTILSNPDNIRMRKPFGKRTRRHSFSGERIESFKENLRGPEAGFPSQGAIGSMPASLSRNSTGSSGTKGIISSDMVSHLIPEKVGRMVFDRAEQRWVKGGSARSESRATAQTIGDMSEEDPFHSIPDLSVDELQELINARDFCSAETATTQQAEDKAQTHPNEDVVAHHAPTDSRPTTKDGASSVQTRSSRFTGSYPKPETRATSWATEDFEQPTKPPSKAEKTKPTIGTRTIEAHHEHRVHNGQVSQVPAGRRSDEMQPRAVTMNFSPPCAPHTEDAPGDEDLPAGTALPSRQRHSAGSESHPLPKLPVRTPTKQSASGRAFPPHSSPGKRVVDAHPISRIDEQDEDNEGQNVELSLIRHEGQTAITHHTPGADPDTSYSFHLSPLADFTMNQADESMKLEVSYVAERTNPKSLRQVHGTFALAAETLIKHITDVEPFEVSWEYLRELDLREKGLITLLKLNQYCPRLEELNAAANRIGQLSGVPSGIRSLDVSGNCLSNLTAWAHLSNLQYVDVSGNELENLDGFSGLVHLRRLKANGNRIVNLNGVLHLDGLLALELRDNAMASVDFETAELFRLQELDLRGNQLSSVQGIDCLPSLKALDLRNNKLHTFKSDSAIPSLRSLRLSRNGMVDLDVSSFPGLRLLYVDTNHLSSIAGLNACEYLESLSMREQTYASEDRSPLTVDIDLLDVPALRKLFLSSNKLSPSTLAPKSPCPDIQFMDLASCSLEHIPRAFGTTFPNIRALNLNFNALAEVAGVRGVTRLSRLSLVGNRVTRLRRLCQVLRDVGGKNGTLRKVDLRGNPITVGFYPAPLLGSGRRTLCLEDGKKSREVVKTANDDNDDDDLGLPPLDGCADIAVRAGDDAPNALDHRREDAGQTDDDVEIDDPYTVPPADAVADRKYLVHLDESTRLRRRVVELMLHAATSGRLKMLDGLDFTEPEGQSADGKKVKKDWVWHRLEELSVLKKRDAGTSSG